ncbi:hypothetical protein [Brevibacillus reuszeri]|uniref:hypothetical protein n=1 Tax=Brevibacillus reuszeri TaxID=54915 RepID=UPI00289C54E2|nr:hypothetical protein [Brevibacillus reuszeri]
MVSAVNEIVDALSALPADAIKGANADLANVKSDLAVPSAVNGVSFVFANSTNTAVNGTTGAVTRPAYNPAANADSTGDITLTGSKNGYSATRVFSGVTVLAVVPASSATMDLGTDNFAGGNLTYQHSYMVIDDVEGNPIAGLSINYGFTLGSITNKTGDLAAKNVYLDSGDILRIQEGLTTGETGTFDLSVTDFASRTIVITIKITQM